LSTLVTELDYISGTPWLHSLQSLTTLVTQFDYISDTAWLH